VTSRGLRSVGSMAEFIQSHNRFGQLVQAACRGPDVAARHARCLEPFQCVIDRSHFEGLCRVTSSETLSRGPVAPYSRDLAVYAAAIGGAE
jgi:hypothetical protein